MLVAEDLYQSHIPRLSRLEENRNGNSSKKTLWRVLEDLSSKKDFYLVNIPKAWQAT